MFSDVSGCLRKRLSFLVFSNVFDDFRAFAASMSMMTSTSDLDVEIDSPKVEVINYSLPGERQAGQMVESVDELIAKLAQEAKAI